MAKTIINEYDNSNPIGQKYSNFTVVVPGFAGKTIPEGILDANGVYECTSQKDFYENIGACEGKLATIAYGPTTQQINGLATDNNNHYGTVTAEDFYVNYKGLLYTRSIDTSASGAGNLVKKVDHLFKYTLDSNPSMSTYYSIIKAGAEGDNIKQIGPNLTELGYNSTGDLVFYGCINDLCDADGNPLSTEEKSAFLAAHTGELYTRADVTTEDSNIDSPGYLVAYLPNESTENVPYYYRFEKATTWESNNSYAIINLGDEGRDAAAGYQNGNQIAYQLLGLGYTVLYKVMDETTPYITDDNTEARGIAALETAEFWAPFKDKFTYDFRYIITGGYSNKNAYKRIVDIAKFKRDEDSIYLVSDELPGRGDCFAIIDIIEDDNVQVARGSNEGTSLKDFKNNQNKLIIAIKNQVNSWSSFLRDGGSFTAITTPYVVYDTDSLESYNYKDLRKVYLNSTFPQSFNYLATAMNTFKTNNEWWPVAGDTRGLSPYKIIGTTLTLGSIAVNALAPRRLNTVADTQINSSIKGIEYSVNVCTNIRKQYEIYGNRTAYQLNEDDLKYLNYLNVRQLLCTLHKELERITQSLRFDPNSDVLWAKFKNALTPVLDFMKSDQGLQDYRLYRVKDKALALVSAKIKIIPIEGTEDFVVDIDLERNADGLAVTVGEE